MSDYLTTAELKALTGYTHREKVCEGLNALGIRFALRPADKFVLVLRSHRDAVLSGGEKAKKRREPNWQAA